ncbi:hypothetical protein HJG60_012276 [Phyllostomus discolor]|uniref:Uncharacterized protein n=1 Tax=Phyllostomus discolor TaxID=89673 RepID=A0A834DUU2_9CHIR|nr:hypothetical protein HJG60_012276 [Phyllostomus discolor]
MTFQLILHQIVSAMRAFVKYVTETPRKFLGNILFCVVILLYLMLWRRYVLRKNEQEVDRFAAQLEESHESTQIRPTQAREVSVSPPEEPRPLTLQALCLAVLLENINRFYPLLEDVLKEQNDELLELSVHRVMMAWAEAQRRLFKESSDSLQVQGAETENILEASQKNVNQVDKEMPDDLVKMAHPEGNIQLLSQEAAKWTEGAQEMRELEKEACVKIEIHE